MASSGRLHCLLHQLGNSSRSNHGNMNTIKQQCMSTINGRIGGPKLLVHPSSSLSDELLDIQVKGLRSNQKVTLHAHVFSECGRHKFESKAEYFADEYGNISVQKDPSHGGSYAGVEPMGLIWGLEPSAECPTKWPRLVKKNVQKPFIYHFKVLDDNGKELQSVSIERWYLADYVERIPVTHGKAEGCLYLPKKKDSSDPMPVLIDIRGGVRFLVEDRPSLLASHGFATFSVNYYMKLRGRNDAPHTEFAYFDTQILSDLFDFITAHPRLDQTRVGIVSSCLGSVLALYTTATSKDLPIKCVSVTGCCDALVFSVGLQLPNGTRIDPCTSDLDYYGNVFEEVGLTYGWRGEEDGDFPSGPHFIPVEDIDIPLLFFIPQDDMYVPSVKCMNRMIRKIRSTGKSDLEVVPLKGAGHFIDAPYLPLCKHSRITPNLKTGRSTPLKYTFEFICLKYLYCVFEAGEDWQALYGCYGGDPRNHAYAVETTWRKTINWFRDQLGVRETYREDWIGESPSSSSQNV